MLLPCDTLAAHHDVKLADLRCWAQRYGITTACDLHAHTLLYDAAQVAHAERTERKQRITQQRQAASDTLRRCLTSGA